MPAHPPRRRVPPHFAQLDRGQLPASLARIRLYRRPELAAPVTGTPVGMRCVPDAEPLLHNNRLGDIERRERGSIRATADILVTYRVNDGFDRIERFSSGGLVTIHPCVHDAVT